MLLNNVAVRLFWDRAFVLVTASIAALILVIASLALLELLFIDALIGFAGIVAMEDLGRDLNLRIFGHKLLRNFNSVHDLDAGINDCIVLHVRHGNEVMDLGHTQEVERIGHQSLEARVLNSGNLLRTIEIILRRITALLALPGIVDQVLGHLTEAAALLAVVDDQTGAATLSRLDGLFNRMREVGTARADVRPEDIRAVAFVVNAARQLNILVWNGVRVTPDVDGQSTDGREEDLNVRAGDELGIHAIGHAEDALTQVRLGAAEAPGNLGQVPDGLNRGLVAHALARGHQNLAIRLQAAGADRLPAFWKVNVGLGHGNGRADIESLVQVGTVRLGRQVAEGINGRNLLGIVPRGIRANLKNWRGQLQVGHVRGIQLAGRHGQAGVDAVRARVSADGIALIEMTDGTNDRPAHQGIRMPPRDWNGIDAECLRGVNIIQGIGYVGEKENWE